MISLLINANSATVQRSIKITVLIFTYNSKVFSLKKHLWALSLVGTPRDNLENRPPSCATPRQLTIYEENATQ